jgi:hypothetical protein
MTVWIYFDTSKQVGAGRRGRRLPKTFRVGGGLHYMSPVQEIIQPGRFVDSCATVFAGKAIVTLLSPLCLGSSIYCQAQRAAKMHYHQGVVAHRSSQLDLDQAVMRHQ